MTCKRPDDGKYKRCYKSCENNADCTGNCGHCTSAASCLAALSLLDPPRSSVVSQATRGRVTSTTGASPIPRRTRTRAAAPPDRQMNATYSPEKQNNKAPLPDSHRSVPSIVSTYSCIASFIRKRAKSKITPQGSGISASPPRSESRPRTRRPSRP